MRLLLAVLVFAACAIGASAATANPPHFPPPKPGDEINITDEPAGENCEFGGVKIEVTSYDRPEPEPLPARDGEETILPPPPPEPTVETYYVCNGAPGENGAPGAPGAPGTTIIGAIPGIDISQDTEVNVNINLGGNRRCRFARTPRLLLPARLADFDNVRVRVDRVASSAAVEGNSIQVNGMRGRKCGPHVVTVRKRGVEPTVRLWTVLSRTRLVRQVLIP